MHGIEESDSVIVVMKSANKRGCDTHGGVDGAKGRGQRNGQGGKALTEHRIRHWVSHASLAHAVRARRLFRRQGGLTFDRRQEPDALARTSGSARGDRGNPVPYRDKILWTWALDPA